MGLTESKGEDIVPLGELVKQDLLGHGAMCQVFQAHWTPKNIPVALKQMMVPEVVPEDLADFRRELQLTRTMKHPNLVCLYGGCAEPPNLYLVMELVAHGAASDLLRTKTTDLPWPLRFRMALDTALGMRFLHSQKVMHRDLKTENLLVNSLQVDAETVVKISDLGISRFSEGNDALMTIGRGTTKWMAPEVLEGSNTYSFPVDVYSFGIILWEFYAQSAPYTEVRSVLRLPQMIIDGYRPPVPHSCPPAYSRLMQDCWHGDPSKRPSFDEVTRRLFEMKDQVCPNLVLPPAVVAIYEKGEKGGEKPLLTSPKRAKPTDAAAIAGEADSGKKQEKEKAKKEKKEKRKTKLKTKEKEDKKDKTATTTAATSSPAATAVTSPQSGSLQQRSAAGDNGSASVGSMVRRWEGGAGGSSPALSTPGAAAGRTAQQPARPPPRPAHSASMAHGVAHSRGGAAPSHSASPTSPPLARTGRAATVSGLPTPTAQAPSAVGGSAIDDNKKKTGGTFLPLGMFGGKKKMESTRN